LAEASLRRVLEDRVFFVGGIDRVIGDDHKGTLRDLQALVDALTRASLPPDESDYVPIYDDANLVLVVQDATRTFHEVWRARLRLPSSAALPPEHWTRIKALTRRLGEFGVDEYDNLRPVGDLIQLLQDGIARFLDEPAGWGGPGEPKDDEVFASVTARVRREVFQALHPFARDRILHNEMRRWVLAYSFRGTGSTRERASEIDGIYNEGAPVPSGIHIGSANTYVNAIRRLVRDAVRSAGGRVTSVEEVLGAAGTPSRQFGASRPGGPQ
jgi:hypothetical protein